MPASVGFRRGRRSAARGGRLVDLSARAVGGDERTVCVPWTVDFSVVNGAPFLTRESTNETLYLAHHRVVRDAAIAFENINEPDGTGYDRPLVTPSETDSALSGP